jgi:hypothetical protein
VQDGWQELDPSIRRSSEMARDWRGLWPAVDCSRLMMMMMCKYCSKWKKVILCETCEILCMYGMYVLSHLPLYVQS